MKKEVLSEILRLNSLISKQLITETGGVARSIVRKIVSELPSLSDEFATTFKSLNRQWAKGEIDALQYLDEVFKTAKGSPYEKELIETIAPIIGRNISDNIKNFKGFITDQFADQVDREELTKVVMDLWDENNIGILPIDKYIKETLQSSIDDVYGEVVSKISKLPQSLSRIGRVLERILPKNLRTIQTGYRKLFTDLDTIRGQMDEVVKEMVQAKAKNPGMNIERYVKRLQDLAASAVGKQQNTFEGIWNQMVRDNPELLTNSSLRREILRESNKLQELMLDPKYNGGWGGLELYRDAWGKLLDVRNLWKNPKDWWQRLGNFILQASPYTQDEIARRIRTYGTRSVISRRAIGTTMSAFVVLPTISAVLTAILGAGANSIDWVRMALFGYEEELFELSKQNIIENFKDGFVNALPNDIYDIPILTTYIDDVYSSAKKGLTWVARDSLTPEQLAAAEEGMSILTGEGSDIEGYEVQKTTSVKNIVKDMYPDIPTSHLAKIIVKSDNKAYYEQTTMEDGIPNVVSRRLSLVDGKIYINNDKINRRVEINKLWD